MEKTENTLIFTDKNGFIYEQVNGDKNGVRIYTLKNGLKVFLAQNDEQPRIQTYIPVKTGSNNDPSDNTGLAHYLEHMLFKGTPNFGTKNWAEEKKLLEEISELFEQHKSEQNLQKKQEIYKKIDEISQKASEFAIANEYDKMLSSIGATGTNAHTWLDETVYKNNIPNNKLEKWLKIEQDRFSEIALRLFHTELESVYEEFNRAQDNDARLVNYTLMEALFPTHKNGQQTTLGKAEHLKNPSMKAIHKYFEEFYVPNNMAMVLVGDFDFDQTITLINQYFGKLQYRELPKKKIITEKPIEKIVEKTVKSPTIPRLQLAWRTDSYGTKEAQILQIIAQILSNNGETGLLDSNINHKQTALRAQSFSVAFKQYGYFSMVIVPKTENTLKEGEKMLLDQLNLLKKGKFPDWMISAIINDTTLQKLKSLETADGLATTLYDTFIRDISWEKELNEIIELKSITKDEIIHFANEFFGENYVAVYKEKGENESLIHVENPKITPIKINREDKSEFFEDLEKIETKDIIEPHFIDYKKAIDTYKIKDKTLSFVRNIYSEISQVHFIFPFGSDHDCEHGLAIDVLQHLGTEKLSSSELKIEFYKLGVTHNFYTGFDEFSITLTGLEENLAKGVEILKHWLSEVKPNQEIYESTVKIISEGREATKKDKTRIMTALQNYAKFGKDSRYRNVVSKERLESIKIEELTQKIKRIFSLPYEIFFYGKEVEPFQNKIKNFIENTSAEIPAQKIFPEPEMQKKVYFINYDMVQMEMAQIAKSTLVDVSDFGKINVFNEYFGRGLSSIVFQELRESKSLAYSAYVSYLANPELGKHNYTFSYIGTQPDKLMIAVDSLQELMQELPEIFIQFENAKNAAMMQIISGRISRTNIFFSFRNLKKLGLDYDFRENIYHEISRLSFQDLNEFYLKNIKSITYNTAIIGKKENLDINAVTKLGTLKGVSLEEIFGY